MDSIDLDDSTDVMASVQDTSDVSADLDGGWKEPPSTPRREEHAAPQPPPQKGTRSVSSGLRTMPRRGTKKEFLASLSAGSLTNGEKSTQQQQQQQDTGESSHHTTKEPVRGLLRRTFSWDLAPVVKAKANDASLLSSSSSSSSLLMVPTKEELEHDKVTVLQNMVSSLAERLEDSQAKVAQYAKVDITPDHVLQLESKLQVSETDRTSLREQVQLLQGLLQQRDQELTSLRLESLERDSMGSAFRSAANTRHHDTNTVRIPTDEWRSLHAERDTALCRAGEMAHQLAQSMAETDDLQERMKETQKVLSEKEGHIQLLERKLKRLERSLEVQQQHGKSSSSSSSSLRMGSFLRRSNNSSNGGAVPPPPPRRGVLPSTSFESVGRAVSENVLNMFGNTIPTPTPPAAEEEQDDNNIAEDKSIDIQEINKDPDNNDDNDDASLLSGDNELEAVNLNAALTATLAKMTKKIELLEEEKSAFAEALEETRKQLEEVTEKRNHNNRTTDTSSDSLLSSPDVVPPDDDV